jgi:putative Mn2+ efflux pump MntP
MSIVEIVALSVALGADLFSVAVPIGMTRVDWSRAAQSSLVFALFHIGMILGGYFIGHWLGGAVEQLGAHYFELKIVAVENCAKIIGAVVLALLGFYMIWERVSNNATTAAKRWLYFAKPLQGTALLMLALSVSIDALAAGFSLGMIDVDLVKLSAVLGGVIFLISLAGLGIGRKASTHIGAKAGIFGGVVLLLLGSRILWTLV